MENPNLTFVTPTLLAGDRSLESVVAHEIAHSWTGNLVSVCHSFFFFFLKKKKRGKRKGGEKKKNDWEHFWLNEGWTVFIECKILQRILGDDFWALKVANGIRDLEIDVKHFGEEHQFTKLNLSLVGIDPDDAFSSVPYEKGAAFLRYLENTVGGPDVFEPFARDYFQAFKVLFVGFFCSLFFAKKKKNKTSNCSMYMKNFDVTKLDTIDWKKWLHSTGMPPLEPIESKLKKIVKELVQKWEQSDFVPDPQECRTWYVQQWEMFLDDLLIEFEKKIQNAKDALVVKEQLRGKLEKITVAYKFAEVLLCFCFILFCYDLIFFFFFLTLYTTGCMKQTSNAELKFRWNLVCSIYVCVGYDVQFFYFFWAML
ncbi:hypothetical protein RFI_24528 [Reticulomyxa filosa]|uniref:Peptidase M1 membrane alanine aminopeptidase domain-containing protein n=1 Tax=Reticulomyxa filosa TaxID=46433 RepID=X6MHF0_RETFI|nr:hypothetical protein RFI_24528 [Reticulomyxa filosa]|eukprot:ETO12847.1 hypothetical protein RFI_24528 [Reticulomyxa filosa]